MGEMIWPLLAAIAVVFLLLSLVKLARAVAAFRYSRAPKVSVEFDYSGGGLVTLVADPALVRNVRIDGEPVDVVAVPGTGSVGVLMPDDAPHHVTFDVLKG